MKGVAVFVLGYRAIDCLRAGSLASIEEAVRRIDGFQVALAYVDNYSRDGSVQWVMKHHLGFDVLLAPVNYLYCRGINYGVQYCQRRYHPDYFLLVDADNFTEPHAFAELLQFAENHPQLGVIQPLVRSRLDPSVLYSCGHQFLDDGQCRPMKSLPEDRSLLLNLPSCSISSTLVRAEVFDRCGLLDPIYEIYFESSDLSFRARRAGFGCACHTGAVTYNEGTSGSGLDHFHNRYYFNRNRLIFWKIHDAHRYGKVRALQLDVYRGLQDAFERSTFGLDAEREAVRRGIRDGLAVVDSSDLLPRPVVRLDHYDKSALILVQEGRSLEVF